MRQTAVFIIWALVISVVLGNLVKISIFSPQIHATLLDFTVMFIVFYAWIFKLPSYISFINHYKYQYIWLGFFLGTGLLGLTFSFFRYGYMATFVGLLYWFRLVLYLSLLPAISQILNFSQIKLLITGLFSAILLTAVIQYLIFPDIQRLGVSEWDPHYFRVVGSLLDPGFIGLILLWGLIYYFFRSSKIAVLFYLMMVLTYSRSTYLAYLAVVIYMSLVIFRSWKFFVSGVILLLVTILVLPRSPDGEGVKLERTNSIIARITNWKNSLQIFSRYPVIGTGFNTYRYAQKDRGFLSDEKWQVSHSGAGADSSFLFTAATSGILGVIFVVLFLSRLYRLPYLQPYLVSLFVHSFFINSAYYPTTLLFLTILTAKGCKSNSKPLQIDCHKYWWQ